ncbi:MAG TPA: PilZ domain-containing protein [Vicinamibacterales bacterium]|nr:PilZ domain-containing protein [Vicinamibacterales bacterium]
MTIEDSDKRDRERIPTARHLEGAVMVFQPMIISDISHTGAQIETSFPLQLDSLHDFRLSLGDRSVVVKGRIAHCHVGELRNDGTVYRTGVEFVEPSEPVRHAIGDFVDALRISRHVRIVDAEVADDEV